MSFDRRVGGLKKQSGVAQRRKTQKKKRGSDLRGEPVLHYSITSYVNKQCSSSDGPCPRPPACPFPEPLTDTHLSEVEFELLAVELGLVQLDASAGSGLWGAEVDPDSPEAFEHLEICLFIVDPKQRLEPFLQRTKTENM